MIYMICMSTHHTVRMVDGFGASEVVVESPEHNALIGIAEDSQVVHSLRAMAARGRSLRRCNRVKQLMRRGRCLKTLFFMGFQGF